MRSLNLLLRFLLELCALAALGWWGYHASHVAAVHWILALAAPLLLAIFLGDVRGAEVWFRLPRGERAALGFLLLELSAASLAFAGQASLAAGLGAAIAVNALMLYLWRYQ
jgi:Protein of unknown function (DUF2568)